MIVKVTPDSQKAESLKKMAKITLERLNKTNLEEYPSNTLSDYYEIIHKLMDALAITKGVKIKGEGAHQELIEYLFKQKIISEQSREFLQQMREYRNRIAYEGFNINKNYIILHKENIQRIIKDLFNLLK